ncbi:hypothetical protein Ddye_031438 [Dipteronia dyeriana]|uniref:RNase H type-1 domain-containing protein n=1 Tax=Dipteronia dyeriana TaxID=168575 RepID=A0AAD9WMK5_9ROSI|nr:hypothetical protein Ddye_031438 [Dipteronia dyeriana]
MFKMNTDTAIDNVGRKVGIGIIFRDSKGNVLSSCSQKILAGYTPQVTEAVALHRGLMDANKVVPHLAKFGLLVEDVSVWIEECPPSVAPFCVG